ncbi:hypothetical protein CDL15_Pgr008775 [Punica granatum]|uniref:Uncharacterized protein n=1 Tax=Punica granatum TaxID=22663 RepID=A0A218VYA2_PUNGR|nr:hypothetical protein CDL15_Pgr008775 [Punica granatum]
MPAIQKNGIMAGLVGISTPPVEKEIHDELIRSTKEEHVMMVGGRKMKMRKALSEDSSIASASKEESSIGGASENISGANNGVVACKNLRLKSHSGSRLVKVETGRFVAFSADYYVPRPHPPKNN